MAAIDLQNLLIHFKVVLCLSFYISINFPQLRMLRSTSSEIFAFYLKKKKKVVKKPKETCQPHSQVLFQIVPAAARGMSHAESREAFLKAFHLVHMIFF